MSIVCNASKGILALALERDEDALKAIQERSPQLWPMGIERDIARIIKRLLSEGKTVDPILVSATARAESCWSPFFEELLFSLFQMGALKANLATYLQILDEKKDKQTLNGINVPEAYFDHQRGHYWIRGDVGWFQINETGLKRELKSRGFNSKAGKTENISEVDQIVLSIQRSNSVEYAGQLAGHRSGAHTLCGRRVLVTQSPVLIEPSAGEFPVLSQFITNLLKYDDCDQTPYVFGWLKIAIESLRKGAIRPGQALVLAGPHGCGKSFLQNIITLLLGGRCGKPYQWMVGGTPFNGDLFESEHLAVEDEAASTEMRSRRHLGAMLKNICATDSVRNHSKNRQGLSLNPFWRLTISVNLEPENLMVLPPLDDSLEDKIILLKAFKQPMPMPTNTDDERRSFMDTIKAELPAFIHWLLDWEIPEALKSERFGVRHFHHQEIVQAIDCLAPEARLLGLIDSELFATSTQWEGSSEDLEKVLTASTSGCHFEARRLLHFYTAAGVYLARLAKKFPERVNERVLKGKRLWTIKQ